MSKLWGGRFQEEADARFARYNESFSFDQRLFSVDVRGSVAYAEAIAEAGILEASELEQLKQGLQTMLERGASDPAWLAAGVDAGVEDIHSFVESELFKLVGDVAHKLHTGRSRNDQVATDVRLFLRDAIDDTLAQLASLQHALLDVAETHLDVPMPGYTHLQKAQPVLFGHFLMAYVEMLARDSERFTDARRRTNRLPLGSGALSGNNHAIDREKMARSLGFEEITYNSMDAVSDRDFVIEYISAASLVMIHLSRLSEDLILYTSNEFGFVEMSDKVSTGSSLMPQKKNPDALELIRGKTGRVVGHQMALLTVTKGLPLCYNKDLQEDKEPLFDTIDTVIESLAVMEIVIRGLKLRTEKMRASANRGYLNATEVADYLVRKGMPFRKAHEVVGQIVVRGLQDGKELVELPMEVFQSYSPLFGDDIFTALGLEATLGGKDVPGGTAPRRVKESILRARTRLQDREAK
ncbi:MAG: argininosuccinate lyase [Myxococcales bacterium]|nr:argininosuccinate lyase [Myxococcales bacterium]MCB9643523.1 argininosuccinate lyase [Myxococcales bacterium]